MLVSYKDLKPDDPLEKTRGQVNDPRMNVTLVPKSPQPVDPTELVQQTVMQGQSEDALRLPRMDPSMVPKPEFDVRKSNLFKVLAGAGALATVLSPDSTAGAVGSGLAAGGAQGQGNLQDTFLAGQEQAREIIDEINRFNHEMAALEQTKEYERRTRLAEREMEQEGRLERDEKEAEAQHRRDERRHQQRLDEIRARDDLTPLEKRKAEAELDRIEAQTRSTNALANNRENNVGGFRTPGAKATQTLQKELDDVDRDLRSEEARRHPNSDTIDRLRGRKSVLESDMRATRLSQSFPNVDVRSPSRDNLVDAAERYMSGQAEFNDVVKLANTALEQGAITSAEFEQFFRSLAGRSNGATR